MDITGISILLHSAMPWDKIHGKYCYLCSFQKTKSIDKKLQQSYVIYIYVLLQNCMYIKECLVDNIVLLSQSKYYVDCFNSLKHNYKRGQLRYFRISEQLSMYKQI